MGTVDPNTLLAHHGWVRALARSLAADSASAEDLEQETWARALSATPRRGTEPRRWLGAILRNTAREGWRRDGRALQARRRLAAEAEPNADLGGPRRAVETPEERQVRMETHKALLKALAELEEPYGATVYLRFVDELSVSEIAGRLAVPEPTVRTRLRRGLELLRERVRGSLGREWRARVLVLALPAAPGTSAFITGIALSTKLKIALCAGAAALLIPLGLQLFGASEPLAVASRPGAEPGANAQATGGVELPDAERAGDFQAMRAAIEPPERAEQPPVAAIESEGGVRVVVRSADSLAPVASAEILVFDMGSERSRDFNDGLFAAGLDMETLLERFGERYGCDADGVAVLPARSSYLHVAARAEGSYVYDYLLDEPPHGIVEELELVLQPTVHIAVRVVDASGVAVEGQVVEFQEQFSEFFGQALVSTLTDAAGRATFRNLQGRLHAADSRRIHRIAAPFPGLAPVAIRLDPDAPPTEELVLRLPALGTARIRVQDAQGFAVKDGRPVVVQALPVEHVELHVGAHNTALGATRAYTRTGLVELRVQPGQQLMAWTNDPSTRELIHCYFDGPRDAGDVVEALLELSAGPVETLLQLVDGAGNPVQSNTLDVFHVRRAGERVGPPARIRGATGRSGMLSAVAPAPRDDDGATLESASGTTFVSEERTGGVRFGWTDWTVGEQGQLDFGAELVAAGVVQDERAQPVAGALLGLNLAFPWSADDDDDVAFLSFMTDSLGRFEIRGLLPQDAARYRLQSYQPLHERSYQPTTIEFAPGTADLVVTQTALPRVAGRVLLDPGLVELVNLRLEVQSEGQTWYANLELDALGRFEHRTVATGRGTLRLLASGGAEVAHSAEFELSPGDGSMPEGWNELDLRGKLFRHAVEIAVEHGTLPPYVVVELHELGLEFSERTPVQLATTREWVTLSIEAEGYVASPSTVVSGKATITLTGPGPSSDGR